MELNSTCVGDSCCLDMWLNFVLSANVLLCTSFLGFLRTVSSKAATCTGETCPADHEGLKLLPFPSLPDFDRCTYHYLKQRAGSRIVQEAAAAEVSTTESDKTEILRRISTALSPLIGHRDLASVMFSGAVENSTSLGDTDCPTRPKLPSAVFHARTTDEISFVNLFRLTVWYHKPMLFFSVADSPSKATLRKAFLDIVEEYEGELIFVLADSHELYKYSINDHRNLLSGKAVSYYLTHALRALHPVGSFNFEPVGASMEDHPSKVAKAVAGLLKSDKHETDTAPPCSNDVPARSFAGDVQDSLKPFNILIAEGSGTLDPNEKFLEVPRASGMSSLDFLHRYFLKGMPVVVTDAMHTWPGFGKWTRKWLFKKYKKQIGKDGYSDDEKVAGNWIVGTKKVRKQLQKGYSLPYFLDLGCPRDGSGHNNISATAPLTSEYFYHTPTTNFATVKHLDTSCYQTYSAQFEGRKQWMLWPPDNDKLKRKPMATVMEPGEILVFYSGWAHATRNIEDQPSLSMSSYFSHPVPSNFLWDNQDFLLNQRQYGTCGTLWKLQTGLPFWENFNFSRFASD